jgi:hypothetical protein
VLSVSGEGEEVWSQGDGDDECHIEISPHRDCLSWLLSLDSLYKYTTTKYCSLCIGMSTPNPSHGHDDTRFHVILIQSGSCTSVH